MNSNIYSLILASLAGFATLVGALLITFSKKQSKKKTAIILGVSAGIMTIVAAMDLLPEAMGLFIKKETLLWSVIYFILFIIVGVLITYILDKILSHHNDEKNLYHVGLITTIAVSLHKFPEGIAIFIASYANINLGISMAIAIGIHHIPEGMAIAAPIYYATGSRLKALKYAFFSSLAEPLGAITALLFLKPFINSFILGALFAIAIGIFIFIITQELIPASKKHSNTKTVLISFFAGLIFMYACQMALR